MSTHGASMCWHLSLLGSHDRAWRDFWPCLRYVVIGEVHVYRGVFGSNVAQLLRRLRRVIVRERIHAYQEVRFSDDQVLETVALPEPHEFELETTAMWLQIPSPISNVSQHKFPNRPKMASSLTDGCPDNIIRDGCLRDKT